MDLRYRRRPKKKTGYRHRVLAAMAKGVMPSSPGVHLVNIEHDPWCPIYQGRACRCIPSMSISGPEGVIIIDDEGNGRRVAVS
jgi:hypothetical protein